ncbi:MAG TPA: class I SAM-dependent methyltransferase [Ktedonosporobacter sp.]|nr:class I SAM-dependent methyltransferase [Ktedonosporobacter sp.]
MSNIHPTENSYALDQESTVEMHRLLEQDLLLNQHMGGLFPLDSDLTTIHDILDIACGPGGWAQEVAFAHRDKRVVGIDISNAMLTYARAQAGIQGLGNARFLFMDATSPLLFPEASFDMVNARFLIGFMWKEAWPALVAECVRVTRPGGMIRLTETDTSGMGVTNSVALETINRMIMKACSRSGRSFYPEEESNHLALTPMLPRFLEQAGCQAIREVPHMINYSAGTPAHSGICKNLQIAMKLVHPFLLKLRIAGSQELETLYQQMLEEMQSDEFRGIWYFTSAYGRKPAS